MQTIYDKNNLNYEILKENYNIINNETDASGNKLDIIEMPYLPNFSQLYKNHNYSCSDISSEITNEIMLVYPSIIGFPCKLNVTKDVENLTRNYDIIMASGGLQYLQPENLKQFFKILSREKCELIFSQPFSIDFIPFTLKKSEYRGNFSWSHPYITLSLKYNFEILKESYQPRTQNICAHLRSPV